MPMLIDIQVLRDQVAVFPRSPGVYLMKDPRQKIIYVGKAKDLRARVRSYLGESSGLSPKTQLLVRQIQTIEYIVTTTEVEAFLLEASLIKKHRPRYNIRLKDDKSYPYLRLNRSHEFPRLDLVRRVRHDTSLYFGPYTSGATVHEMIRFLNRSFLIRDCTDAYFKTRKRPCMTYQIGRCQAPCVGMVDVDGYKQGVTRAVDFLRGHNKKLLKELKLQMKELSQQEKYEAAAKIRDSIRAIEAVLERQNVVDDKAQKDQDVFGCYKGEDSILLEILFVRQGRLIGRRGQLLSLGMQDDVRDILISFINQYYADDQLVPDELLLPIDIGRDLTQLLTAVLVERSGGVAASSSAGAVKVRFPTDQRGQELIEMANRNAENHFRDQFQAAARKKKGLEDIRERFQLPSFPQRIECFDISNFQGSESVASQVVFEDGSPARQHYRRYKIKTVEGANDFASMKEVLLRRFTHKEWDDPDLIVVDGGMGQLRMALEALKEVGRPEIPVVGLAKARTRGEFHEAEVSATDERFFLPGRQNPIRFAPNSEAFQILVGLRDEAHRFAITYHRRLREEASISSVLDSIHGLGEKRKKALLRHFASLEELKKASIEEIAQVQGLNRTIAERISISFNEA